MNRKDLLVLLLPTLLGTMALSSVGVSGAPSVEQRTVISPTSHKAYKNGEIKISILHQEDYMDETLIDEFEKRYPECKVIFNKSETNETLYSEIQTGKSTYNLVTASEYMIQRMASEGLIRKIELPKDSIYNKNVSPWLSNDERTGKINTIEVRSYEENEDGSHELLGYLDEFTAGYMWGTLGTVVNPYYAGYDKFGGNEKDPVLRKEKIKNKIVYDDLRGIDGWSTFWNPEYKGTHSIKDSMRDTYALGVFEVFKDKFLDSSISSADKNKLYFNNHEPETIKLVQDKIIDLKDNIFGFEVDSGKNDIVTGKIGMNLAWSGDAAFSILQGNFFPEDEEGNLVEKPDNKKTYLYYNIPESGSNVWFDGFAMPKTTVPGTPEYEYTIKFIEFMSEEAQVVANMSYTGFTSFMSGPKTGENAIKDYILDTFDQEESIKTQPYDISYFFDSETVLNVDPDSFEGRGIVAQYPEESDIDHLYVMEDYGQDNGKIVQMWEEIKVNPLPTWVIVFLITFVVVTFVYFGTYKFVKAYRVKKRKQLRNQK